MPQGTRGRPSLTAEHLTSGELQRRDSVTLDAEAVDLGSDYSESPRRQMTEGFTNFSYGVLLPGPVMDNKGILSDEEFGLATVLQEAGQGHLMAQWPMPGTDDDLKRKLLQQAKHLHETSPGEGGIIGYASRARKLLADSAEGVNPLDGWSPSVPEGVALEPGSARLDGTVLLNYNKVWPADLIDSRQAGYGVESVQDVCARMQRLFLLLEEQYAGKCMVLTSHADTLQIMQCYVAGADERLFSQYRFKNGEVRALLQEQTSLPPPKPLSYN